MSSVTFKKVVTMCCCKN